MKKTSDMFANMVILTTLSLSFIGCNEIDKKDSEPKIPEPAQIVDVSDAKKMYDNYTKRRKPLIERYEDSQKYNDNGIIEQQKGEQNEKDNNSANQQTTKIDSFPVARYVYYDYKTIKDYIAYIEQEAEDQGLEISTLRFYFSNYGQDMKVENAKPRQNSIFIMPTLSQDNQTYGFFLDKEEKLKLLTDDLNVSETLFKPNTEGSKMKASFFPEFEPYSKSPNYTPFQTGKSYILNEGGVRPPPYN